MADAPLLWRFDEENLTVVLREPEPDDVEWRARVAAEERGRRTVFVTPDFVVLASENGVEQGPSSRDVSAVARMFKERGSPKPFQLVTSPVAGAGSRMLPAIGLSGGVTRDAVMTTDALRAKLLEENEEPMRPLIEQLRSPLGVLPFVGAGMTAAYGFPLWSRFLLDVAADFGLEQRVRAFLAEDDYEGAAEALDEHDPIAFADRVRYRFEDRIPPDKLRAGALAYLPLLSPGPVITTNFDHCVEDAFDAMSMPAQLVTGKLQDRIVEALHRNTRSILKIHGSVEERTFRVFTERGYKEGYEEGENTLSDLAWVMFTNRPLLFLGASLEADRTVAVLTEIQKRLSGLRHYAIVPAHHVVSRQRERQTKLSRIGVRPLWYAPGDYDRVNEILRDLVQRAATTPVHVVPRWSPRPPAPPSDGAAFRALGLLPAIAPHAETAAIARRVREGRIALFLGAYAHLGGLPVADEFYTQLAERFERPQMAADRAAIIAHVASRRGIGFLWQEIRAILDRDIAPSPIYQLAAALPGLYRELGHAGPSWIFTTNYDTAIEKALTGADEPFHLLYYMLDREAFAHVDPVGNVRVIDRPEAIGELAPRATVVVKLNGGIVLASGLPESAVIATGHFETLATRLPNVLPACARRALEEHSLLFLGHGLHEPDVRKLVDVYAAPSDDNWWAVQRAPHDPERRADWEEQRTHLATKRLMTVEADLADFTRGLYHQVLAG